MTSRTTKLLIATGIYPPDIGGPATYLEQFVPFLRTQEVEVRVVTFAPEAGIVEEEGVRVVRISRQHNAPLRLLRYVAALYRSARHADVIYVHDMSIVGLAVRLVHMLSGVPYIVRIGGDFVWEQAHQHGATRLSYLDFQGHEPLWYRMRRILGTWILIGAKRVIVPSAFLSKVVMRWGVERDLVTVAENAIEAPLVLTAVPQQIQGILESGQRIVVSSGRFVSWKHFDAVIEAASLVHDVHVLLIGDGPERAAYERLVTERGLQGRVTMVAALSRAELFAVLGRAHCLVLPSEGETFSFVTLEALAAGAPAILLRASALPDLFGAYEGKGVTFIDTPTGEEIADALGKPITRPVAGTIAELKERFDIQRHFASVYGIVREISFL